MRRGAVPRVPAIGPMVPPPPPASTPAWPTLPSRRRRAACSPFPALTAMRRPRRWAVFPQIPMVCTICWAMSGNGSRIAGIRVTRELPIRLWRARPAAAKSGCFVVGPGTASRLRYVRPIGIAIPGTNATKTSASEWRDIESAAGWPINTTSAVGRRRRVKCQN